MENPILALKRQGLSFTEIAEKLGLTSNTVQGRYYAALKAETAPPRPIARAKLTRAQLGGLHRSDGSLSSPPVTLRKFSWEADA